MKKETDNNKNLFKNILNALAVTGIGYLGYRKLKKYDLLQKLKTVLGRSNKYKALPMPTKHVFVSSIEKIDNENYLQRLLDALRYREKTIKYRIID